MMLISDWTSKDSYWRFLIYRSVMITMVLLAGVLTANASPLINEHMAQLREQGQLVLGGQQIAAVRALPAFYAARDYQPVKHERVQ